MGWDRRVFRWSSCWLLFEPDATSDMAEPMPPVSTQHPCMDSNPGQMAIDRIYRIPGTVAALGVDFFSPSAGLVAARGNATDWSALSSITRRAPIAWVY